MFSLKHFNRIIPDTGLSFAPLRCESTQSLSSINLDQIQHRQKRQLGKDNQPPGMSSNEAQAYETDNGTMSLAGWSLDFCLSCDKQIDAGLYCSQACRLADYQRGQSIAERISVDRHPSVSSESSSTGAPVERSIFWLPPSINSRSPKLITEAVPLRNREGDFEAKPGSSLYHASSHSHAVVEGFSLDPPSSTKPGTLSGNYHIPQATREELRRYDDAFDHSRRRRERKQSRP